MNLFNFILSCFYIVSIIFWVLIIININKRINLGGRKSSETYILFSIKLKDIEEKINNHVECSEIHVGLGKIEIDTSVPEKKQKRNKSEVKKENVDNV